jgi:TP901 family phage tail tape measure protein
MPQINANLTLNTAQAQATFNQFVRTINSSRIGQPLGRISGDAAEFNKSMQAATARVTAFGLSAGAIIQVKNAIIGAANATIEVDKQLIELNTFLGQSTSELGKFSKSLFQVAKNTAAPFSEAAGAAKEFARQGLSANEVLERTESALTLARISGLDFKDSVQGITTAINSFGKEALKATEITNKLIAVDTRFAVSSADLNEAIRRVGSSAEESGVGIDSLIAAVTAAQQTTGRGGAVIGNALKTIFTRLQRPEVLTQLEQLGVAVKDQNGFLLDGIGILKNFSDATKNLSQAERSRTAELIGGVYQINQLNALIKDLSSSNSVYANSLRISNLATDEATKKNEELNKSMSSMLQSIKTTATEVASSFGSSFLRPVVEIGATLSESLLNKMNPSEVGSKLGSELIKGLGGALGEGLSRTALPILGAIGGLLAIKMGSFGKTAFKELGKASGDIFANQKDLELQKRINDVIGRNPSLITAIIAGKKTQAQAEAQILDFILKQNQQLRMQSSLSQRTFSNVTQGQKATPRKKIFGIFADGYLPNFAMSAEQQEVATAKAYGAKNPVPRVIQATIKGKTQRVMVNSEEDVIPNFAGTGDTAIIPRYRKMQDIPRMSPGYIPNFANFDFLKNNQSEFYSSRGSKYILQKAIALAQKTPGGKISLKSFIDQFQEFSEHPFESYPSQRHGFNSEMLKDPTNWKGPSPIGFRGASLDEILAIRSGKKFISDGRNNYGERKNITHFAPTPKNAFGDYGRRTGYAYTVAAAPLAKRTSIFAADTNTAYNYAANDVTKSDVLKTFKITGDELQILDDSSFASGYVPNFAFSSMKSPASEDRKFVDPETYSYLRYKLSNDKKAIDLKFSKSEMKGQGWQMFERLGKTARRMGLPVRSSNLSSQANDVYDITDASLARAGKYGIEEVLKVGYPQLIHRQKGSSKNTTLSLNIDDGLGHKNKELSGKDIFSVVSDFASKKYKGDAKLFRNSILDGSFDISNVETNFAGGRIPNFAKRIDVIERIGKEEIFARFQKHFEAGKDYQGFYNIHGEEFGGKKLSPQEAKIYANITSAISPSVPDYVAAQFAAPIFNRYMKTKSTNVEDYFDLAPSKKVSRHKNVFGLGLFGLKGTISKQGNIRTRDDVRRSGLSKALRGLDLGSDDTAKTRHYARAILQDKTAFPIDTNVIQAILGGKTPSKTEAAKLISLANEFATLNKIETGAAGLQAAIFKSNSKHSEKYSPDTVRSALSGIQGRSGGYVPNFAKILIAAKYYDGLKVGRAKGVNISKTGDIQNVGREVFGGIGFSTSRIGKGYASAVRTTSPTTSLKKASEQAGVTKSIIIPVVASSAVNDPVPENLKTNEALLQQFLANHPQPKEIVASLSQQGFNVKSILNSHSGSEIKSIIDILSSDLFNKKILVKSANELKDPRLVKFFAPGGVKARGPKGTYAFGSSIASMQQGEYASKIPGKHKSYPILVTGKSGPEISEPINAEEIFPGITDNKNRLFFSSVYQFGTRTLDTDNPEHMELLGRLGYSQKRLRQENLMAQGYVPNFASTFNAEKIKKMGGFVGQANKASAPGLYNILNRIGIPIDLDNITKKGLTDALSSKENKLKLYNFLKQEPIEITNYPDSYSEVKDGNHRFTLAQFAGIKNIPAKYKDNFSGGYIPNFSGLSDAVSREKTMSGLPASQIMAHFDRGGNPIAVTNKRDEPNGLKDVPNFAIPRSLLRLLSTRRSGLINPVTGGAEQFVGNIVIGILNQLAENEKVSTDIAAGATAGIPIGFGIKNILKAATSKRGSKGEKIAAGLTGLGQLGFGALSGFSAKTELEKRLNEKKYSEALDRSRTSFQNLTENTAELADTFAKLDSAYRDPQADPRTITKLAKKQEDLLNKITFKNPDLVAKLASESDLGKKQAIIEESTKEGQRIQSIREESLKFLSRGSISGKDAPEKISDFFASIINSGNPELLNQNLSGAQPSDFANILKKGGLDVEEFSKIFQTDDLKKSFIEGLIVTQKLTQLSNEQASVVRELSKPLTEKKQNIQDTRAVRLAVSASLKEQLPELASFAGGFSRRAGISAASEAELAITRSEASVAFNNSLMSELANSKFSDGLPSSVRDRLLAIQSPSIQTGKELESLKALPGLSKEQIAGIDKLIGFNSQQNRKLETANKVANETKNVQLKFLALQEKLAFGGDIRSSIDPEARAEAMSSAIRGPLTYQLGGLLGSRRTQIGGATDFLTDTIKKYPGLLQTKDGKEPADIQAVKRELTGLNAMDMQRDLLKRASMAEMMGLGQTGSMLRSKAFDRNYLLESAGLKTSALFSSPEVPEEVKKAMEGYEKFNVEGVRQFKGEERDLKNLEDQIAPIKQAITNKLTAEGSELAKAFKASLTQTFGEKGITADLVNVFGKKIDEEAINKNVDNIAKAYAGQAGLMPKPAGIPSNANGLTKYSSSIADAVKREKTALASRGIMGVPNFAMASINLERSPDLVNASNPFGFGVTNSIDEKNGLRSLGMRSSGFVPNYALFGDKVAAAGLAAAQSDKLYAYDKGTGSFHKVSPSGKIDFGTSFSNKSLPKDAKTISSELYASAKDPVENTQKRGSNILGIKDPKVSKLNELKISLLPKSQTLDPILENLYGAGKLGQADNLTPENLRNEVNKLTGGERSLIKTAFGPKNYGGYGVFGKNTDLGLSDYEEIIKRYKSGEHSGFFVQKAVQRAPYGEIRVHAAVDKNGRVKLVKGGSVSKYAGGVGALSKEHIEGLMAENPGATRKQVEELARANKKAAEAIAIKATREYAKKFGVRNTIFGVDTLATTLQSAKEAGASAKMFNSPLVGNMGAIVIEMNPTDISGSSGYMKGSAVQGLVNSVLGIENKPQGNAGNVLMGTQNPQAPIPSGAPFNPRTYETWLRGQQRMAERLASQNLIPDESTAQSTPGANRPLAPAPRATSPGSNLIGTQQQSMPAGFTPKGGEAPPISGGAGGGLPPRDARGRFTARGGGTPTGGSGGPPPPSSYFGSMAFGSGGPGDAGGGSPPAGSSTFLSKAKAAGAFGLKGLSVLFGAMQAKESYDQAKEGNYGKSTLAGLSSAASFAGLSKSAGRVAGPAGVALGGLMDLESDLTLAKDFQDILGRKRETEYLGEDGEIKKQRDNIGIGDVVGTAIGAAVSAPATAAILGYRTGNVFENKLKLGDRLGDFASVVASGGRSLGLTSGPIRGMKSKEAYDSDQIKVRKMELIKEINKYNRAAGNPEISVKENLLKSKKAQKVKDEQDISALQKKLDEEAKANRDVISARAAAAGTAETAILNKNSTEQNEARRAELRRSFIESFEKNGGSDRFQTTKEKIEYFLSLERQLNQGSDPNNFGTFKPKDFKDPEFAKSFGTYKKAQETEAAREAKRVFPKTSEEFKNRLPQQSFPDDVLREAVRTGRSAERVIQDREDEKVRRGLIPPVPLPSQTEIRNRPDPFTRDVLLEAARRRVPAEKIIQEREAATKDQLLLLPPALMGEIAIAGKSGSLIPGPLPSKIQGSEDFDPNKPDSYPADVVAEAIRTGRKPEQVIKDRAEGIQATDIPGGYSRGIIEEAMRRRVSAEQVMRERADGAIPNFAKMSNSMMSSGDVYSRMRATSSRSSMSGYSGGQVPNFAVGDFTNAISEAMKNGITSAFPNGGSSSSVSNSNVINIDGRTSIQNAPDEAMQGIISILFDKFPELKKLGPSALNFKR